MRLKHLLLSTLLFVLVRSNKYTSDYKCQHDGYSAPDGNCQCTDYYGKKDCSQIECVNTGVLAPFDRDLDYDQRCSCPPGFLGLHCEPVQCVDGDVKSFDLVSHARDVSVIITYNKEFQAQFKSKDKGPPIQNTICDAVFGEQGVGIGSRIHFYLMEIDYTVDDLYDCKELFDYAFENSCTAPEPQTKPESWSCEGKLTTKYIQRALDQMGEDSRLIIISNLGIDDYTDDKGIQAIRKKAISMRIQMHSLVISPRTPEDNTVYFKTGYQALRELSESTLGFFINPFDGSGGQKLGDAGITEILKLMMPVFFDYVVVDRLVTNSTSCNLPVDYTVFRALDEGPNKFWLTVISNYAPMTVYTTDWIGGPVPKKVIDSGYFNAYTLDATYGDVIAYKPFSVYGKQQKCVPTNVMVLAKSGHLARFAITNSEELDATSPYAISGEDAKNILVGHFTQHYHEENLEKLHLEFSTTDPERLFTLNLDPFASPRNCQYNAKFGEVSCNDGDDTFIRVRDYDSGAAVTVQNLYCSPKDTAAEFSSAQLFSRLDAEDGDAPAPECKESPIKLKEDGKRALIISAHATETIFELFNGNKNSAIRYLNDLDDLEIYDQYILNIYNGDQATNAIVVDCYADFKADLMSTWHQYTRNETKVSGDWVFRENDAVPAYEKTTTEEPTESTPEPTEADPIYFDPECTASVSAVFPLEDLTNRFTNAHPNSDIIFIYDRAITIDDEDLKNVLKDAYTRRLRLIVLLLGCESKDFSNSDALKKWNSIASKTGGFASHFSQPSDLNKFLASYVDFVKGQAAASIDNKESSWGFVTDPITSTPFQSKSGGNYTIIVNSVPVVAEATLSTGAKLVNPTILGNSIALFNYMASDDQTLTVTAAPPQYYFFYASIRVLDMNEDIATIGFTKSKDDSCVEKEYPDYVPHEAQYPITSASADDSVKMTLFDSAGVPFRTGPASGSGDNFVLDYNWRCTDNENVFYISADVTLADKNSFTRLFTTECIGKSEGIACVNGDQNADKTKCICPHDYSGDVCEIPVCQNGGEVTSSLECKCKDGYSGFFCESYDKCKVEADFMPDFKSIASTVVFIVEKSVDVTDKLQKIKDETLDNVRAAQYVIIQYGNSSDANVVISTTDKAILVKELKAIEPVPIEEYEVSSTATPDQYFDAIPAFTLAMNAQVTGSAQIFWFAETDNAENFIKALLDGISHQRVTVSALFTQAVAEYTIHPVQLSGGSVFYYPTEDTDNTYKQFFSNYVAEILQFQSAFELRPNLLSSSTRCNVVHKVNIDQSAKKLIVAASGDEATITISKAFLDNLDDSPIIPGGRVFTFPMKEGTKAKEMKFAGAGEVTVTITNQPTDVNCSSTVTAFSQNQVAYGYIKDENDIKATITTHKGEHLLVTYWTSESVEDTPTPTATVTPISLENGFGNTTTLYTTVRNNCSFSLSVPVECNEEVDAVGVTMSNWIVPNGGGTAYKVDKYIAVLCPEGSCEHGNQTASGDCECDPFWGGDYCNQFLCDNGVVVGDICSCYVGYTGEYCDEKVDKTDRAGIAFLIIQDVCGDDDDLKDTSQSVLTNYVNLLKTTDNFYLGTNSPDNTDVLLVKSVSELTDAMAANRAAIDKCSKPTLGAVLDKFYTAVRQPPLANSFMLAAASDPAVGNARVAHVTTVGVDSSTGSNLYKLAADFTLTMEFVGVTYKNEYFPNPNAFNQFAEFSGEFLETYDPEVALLDLVNAFGSDIKPSVPAGDTIDRCIQNLQAAIVFHTDISNVPNGKMNEYRTKAQKIFNSVTKYFTIPDVKTIDIDDDTCEFNTTQMEQKTLFYGSIYANQSSIITPTFCMSNMDSYPKTVGTADYKQAPLVNLQKVVDSYTKWYNTDVKMKCHCFDYLNPNTTKIILWTPLWPESLDTDPVKFDGFNLADFTHVVMPFGFSYDDSPLWNKLVPDRDLWLTDASASNYDEDEIIQDIWTIICKLAGHIDESQTAEPFNPYTTKKPRTGEEPWKQFEVTDDPSGDSLPR